MLRPMKLEGALKLYIALYTLAFGLTFLTSVPMLMHVAPDSKCLLYVSSMPLKYGPASACHITGVIPILVALMAFGLIFVNFLELQRLQDHIKLPEVSSDEFREAFKQKFWRIIKVNCVVILIVLINAGVLTVGYTTSCTHMTREVELILRPGTSIRLDQYNQFNNQNNNQQRNDGPVSQTQGRVINDNDYQRRIYSSNGFTDSFGRDSRSLAITCRKTFLDKTMHFNLKKNTFNDPSHLRHYGVWNRQSNNILDPGDLEKTAFTDNLFIELSMAGAWISIAIWVIILALMLKERHHLKAFITDESMWGGSVRDYGEGSVRSGRSRKSNRGLMSPIDFENLDRMSHASKMSFDRTSRVSRSSRASKGTSYKDMGRSKPTGGSSSYKNMKGSAGTPSRLTISRLEQVPEVDSGFQVKRLLSGTGPVKPPPSESDRPQPQRFMSHPPTAAGYPSNPHFDDLNDTSLGVDGMSMMTVTGAIIGPGAQPATPGKAGGLMDFFGGSSPAQFNPEATSERKPEMKTEESDVI